MDTSRSRAPGLVAMAAGLVTLAVATALALRGMEPFATWYYVFAWYGTLVALDGALATARPERGFHLLSRRRHLLSLLAWSVPFWLFFELLNFRVENWFYVFVPADPVARWAGITVSFATVLPALFLLEAGLERAGVGREARWRPVEVDPELLRKLGAAGAAMLVLPLVWPRLFYPLIWGGVVLLLDPLVYRADPRRSLLGDLERGRPGRILRLLLAGLVAGFLWEAFNVVGRGSWIYTVPGLETLKLFEMPPLGFLGFPPLALEAFAFWQALVVLGLTAERRARRPAVVVAAGLAAAVFSAAVLTGMERWTIVSRTPSLAELPGVPAAGLTARGHDPFTLAGADPAELAERMGVPVDRAEGWVDAARLATLRGIGSRNAARLLSLGIGSPTELAGRNADALTESLARTGGPRLTEARVRVWIRGARRAIGSD